MSEKADKILHASCRRLRAWCSVANEVERLQSKGIDAMTSIHRNRRIPPKEKRRRIVEIARKLEEQINAIWPAKKKSKATRRVRLRVP